MNKTNILFKASIRVLEVLMTSDKAISYTEITQRTGMPYSNVKGTIDEFIKLGLVKQDRKGNFNVEAICFKDPVAIYWQMERRGK
jgi:DNA-binding IclR family transcriptional regulator